MLNLTIADIFMKIDGVSSLYDVNLPYATKNFFVSLLEYCEKHGCFDDEKNAFFVDLSMTSFCKIFGLSNHTVQSAVSSLCACGLIERVKYNPSFGEVSSGKISTNKPFRTYIFISFLKN